MWLSQLSMDDAAELATASLGLDESVSLFSTEGLAESIRRTASFMCPTSPGRITDAIAGALKPLAPGNLEREQIKEVIEVLASSDLLELREGSAHGSRLLYLAPPSYVEKEPGTYLLAGVRANGAPILDADLSELVEHDGPARFIQLPPADADSELQANNLRPISRRSWVAAPTQESAEAYVGRYTRRLRAALKAGQLQEVELIDPSSSVRYYRGRWRAPQSSDTGIFVARRPQAYGADLWCVMSFESGLPDRVLELPVSDPVVPGRDQAWRLQAAIDATNGRPQLLRISRSRKPVNEAVFDFFAPLPGFAERYMELVGRPIERRSGALFSFQVPARVAQDARNFIADMLWIRTEETQDDI